MVNTSSGFTGVALHQQRRQAHLFDAYRGSEWTSRNSKLCFATSMPRREPSWSSRSRWRDAGHGAGGSGLGGLGGLGGGFGKGRGGGPWSSTAESMWLLLGNEETVTCVGSGTSLGMFTTHPFWGFIYLQLYVSYSARKCDSLASVGGDEAVREPRPSALPPPRFNGGLELQRVVPPAGLCPHHVQPA